MAHKYVQVCMVPQQAQHLIDRAIRIAKATRSVTCISVPDDVAEFDYEEPPRKHGAVFSGGGLPALPRLVPEDEDLRRAAEVLNAGQKVSMLIGAGARHAAKEVREIADILGCGVTKALNGRDALPDDLPFVTGAVGLLGTRPSYEMMENCDTLFMVGSGFPYSEWLPEPGQARGVQIDIDGKMLGIRYPMEVNVIGDSKKTLRALIPYLRRKEDRSWREKIEKDVSRWWEILENQAMQGAEPLNPMRVFHELSPRLPDHCIVKGDSGSATNWWARNLKLREAARNTTLAAL